MIGIGIGNIFYKDVMTKEELKTMTAGKQVDFQDKGENQKRKDWFVFFKVFGFMCLFYLAYRVS